MRFSVRTDWHTASNRLTEKVSAEKKLGHAIIDLTESNPTRCSFKYLAPDILRPLCDPANIFYEPDPRGLLEARKTVCAYYAQKGITVAPHQVFLTASTSEAYTFLFRLLCDPGDSLLAPEPSYPLFDYLSGLSDVGLVRYALNYGKGWRMDFSHLKNAAQENLKGVILVNPNNPTGNFIKPDELKALNAFCAASETAIISDEVFFDFAFGLESNKKISLAGNSDVLTFTLSGISKILGLPQMKLSWIVVSGPAALCQKALERLEIIADTHLSVNTPSQRALAAWMDRRQAIGHEISERLMINRDHLRKELKGHGNVEILECEGGWYLTIQVDTHMTDEALALELLEKRGVLVHPGYFYDFSEGAFLVMSLLPSRETFLEGAKLLAEALK